MSDGVTEPPNHSAAELALMRGACDAVLSVYCEHTIPVGPALPEPEPPEFTEEMVRASLSAAGDQSAEEVPAQAIHEASRLLQHRSRDHFVDLMICVEAYGRLATRLRLKPEEILDYVRQERCVIARLYFELRQAQPSQDQIRRLAYQVALDARHPLEGSLRGLSPERHGGIWRFGIHRAPVFQEVGLAPPQGHITAISPLAAPIFEYIEGASPRLGALAAWIEQLFHGQPRPEDALVSPEHHRLEYCIDGDRLRLWVAGIEVRNISRKDEQALLRHLCKHPRRQVSGAELKNLPKGRSVTNASQAAAAIRKALGEARPGAENWLLTSPLRWVEGLIIRPRR